MVLLAIALLFIALSLIISVLGGVQFVESPSAHFAKILTLAHLQPGERFIELGSGIGSLSLFVASRTSAIVMGIDISPALTLIARWRGRKLPNVTFTLGDVRKINFGSADVLYIYMLPPLLSILIPKFRAELRPGARVISYAFPLPGRKPIKTIPLSYEHGHLYLYQY